MNCNDIKKELHALICMYIRAGKIPENGTFVPVCISMNFGDFSPLNPRNLSCPRPRSIPELWQGCIPVPPSSPRRISGIFPQTPYNSGMSPSPPRPRGEFRGFSRIPRKSPISYSYTINKKRLGDRPYMISDDF